MVQRLYVVMGVAGSGKTSIGESVAEQIGGTYIDGDDYHPQSNIDKMASGDPLTDEDRWPWLEIISGELARMQGIGLVGCSALKKSYRDFITKNAGEPVQFLYLNGSKDLIAERMAARTGHFMPTSLLDSQFEALEEPDESENAISIDISGTEPDVVKLIVDAISANLGE
ncbi:MAG: gluconokinase [Pseudomonadota bacterium]